MNILDKSIIAYLSAGRGERGEKMLRYDLYIKEKGKKYYDRYALKGSAEHFYDLLVMLKFYRKMKLIDKFFMFEMDPEEEEEQE